MDLLTPSLLNTAISLCTVNGGSDTTGFSILEFVLGVVVGGVFGLILDRLWVIYEARPRIDLQLGLQEGNLANGRIAKSLMLSVINQGRGEIPEFSIDIYNSDRGTYTIFHSEDEGPLISGQKREFIAPLFYAKDGYTVFRPGEGELAYLPESDITNWFLRNRKLGVEQTLEDMDRFVLRLCVTKSERLLYEDEMAGSRLAQIIVRSIIDNQISFDYYDGQVVAGKNNSIAERMIRRFERLLKLRLSG